MIVVLTHCLVNRCITKDTYSQPYSIVIVYPHNIADYNIVSFRVCVFQRFNTLSYLKFLFFRFVVIFMNTIFRLREDHFYDCNNCSAISTLSLGEIEQWIYDLCELFKLQISRSFDLKLTLTFQPYVNRNIHCSTPDNRTAWETLMVFFPAPIELNVSSPHCLITKC